MQASQVQLALYDAKRGELVFESLGPVEWSRADSSDVNLGSAFKHAFSRGWFHTAL
jgi:hypothetical protein